MQNSLATFFHRFMRGQTSAWREKLVASLFSISKLLSSSFEEERSRVITFHSRALTNECSVWPSTVVQTGGAGPFSALRSQGAGKQERWLQGARTQFSCTLIFALVWYSCLCTCVLVPIGRDSPLSMTPCPRLKFPLQFRTHELWCKRPTYSKFWEAE